MSDDKRAHLDKINRDWEWLIPETRNEARVWMTVELEAAWAEVERLQRSLTICAAERETLSETCDDLGTERNKLAERVKGLQDALTSILDCDECQLCKQDRRQARSLLAEKP